MHRCDREGILKHWDVFNSWLNGAEVEYNPGGGGSWILIKDPQFNANALYRVALTKPSIDWFCVSEEYNYMARNLYGFCYLFKDKPDLSKDFGSWKGGSTPAVGFASLVLGTCDWKDSLVMRPGCSDQVASAC